MAITLRSVKGAPLTTEELDGNFVDLNARVVNIEENGVGGGGGIAFTTGTGLVLSNDDVLSHADTSNQASVTNLGRRVIQDISLDGFGHVTFLDNIDLDTIFVPLSGGVTITGNLTLDDADLSANAITVNNLTVNTAAVVNGTITANSFVSTGTGVPTINSATNIVLNAVGAVVVQSSPLRLNTYTTAQANLVSGVTGDVIFVSDGNSGSPCLAVWDGTGWKATSLGANISSA